MTLSPSQANAWRREMSAAEAFRIANDLDASFRHLERAHIVGQRNVLAHTRAHIGMLRIGIERQDKREIFGQLLRILAALTKTLIWVPVGNTGGADVSALRSMPIPDDLREYVP